MLVARFAFDHDDVHRGREHLQEVRDGEADDAATHDGGIAFRRDRVARRLIRGYNAARHIPVTLPAVIISRISRVL